MKDLIECIRNFHNVVNEGGFSSAAKLTHSTSSSVTKRIQYLETYLQTQLLDRTTRSVRVTEAGRTFYDKTIDLLAQWQDILYLLENQQNELMGQLHVASTRWLGQTLLVDLISDYLLNHPKVKIQQSMYISPINMLEDDIDICIATSEYQVPNLKQQKINISTYYKKLFASKNYVKQFGTPKSIEELKEHRLITVCSNQSYMDEWQLNNKKYSFRGDYHVNDGESALKVMLKGLGIIYGVDISINPYKEFTVPIMPELKSEPISIDLLFHEKKYISYLQEDFIDYMVKKLIDIFSQEQQRSPDTIN